MELLIEFFAVFAVLADIVQPVGGAIIFLICLVRIVGLLTGRLSSDDVKTISDA